MKSNVKPVWIIAASVAAVLIVGLIAWNSLFAGTSYSNTPHSKATTRKADFKAQWNQKSGE